MISVKRLQSGLDITRDQAKAVRTILETKLVTGERATFEQDSPEYELHHDKPSRKLYAISRAVSGSGFYGVEIVRSIQDRWDAFLGLTYLNAGDCYVTTLLYDHGKGKWILACPGDIIEKDNGRRFE